MKNKSRGHLSLCKYAQTPTVQYRPRSNQKFFRNSAAARTGTKQTFIREQHFSINDKRVIGGNKNRSKQKKPPFRVDFFIWRPQGDSNPRYRRESPAEQTFTDVKKHFKLLFFLNTVFCYLILFLTVLERYADITQTRKKALFNGKNKQGEHT